MTQHRPHFSHARPAPSILPLLLLLAACARHDASALAHADRGVTERELTRDEQFALLDAYAPVAVPREATDVHLRYQRFQDWSFDATFVLPRGAFEGYVRRLVPDDAGRFHGRRIGVWEGSVDVDAPGRRIHVVHSSS